jgi:hypothetical protein
MGNGNIECIRQTIVVRERALFRNQIRIAPIAKEMKMKRSPAGGVGSGDPPVALDWNLELLFQKIQKIQKII